MQISPWGWTHVLVHTGLHTDTSAVMAIPACLKGCPSAMKNKTTFVYIYLRVWDLFCEKPDLVTLVPYMQFLFGGLEILKKELDTSVFYFPAMCRDHPWTSHIDVDPEKFSKALINSKGVFKGLGFNLPSLWFPYL